MSPPPALVAFDLGGVLVHVEKARLARDLEVTAAEIESAFFHTDVHDRLAVGALSAADYLQGAARHLGRSPAAVEAAWRGFVSVAAGASELVARVRCDVVAWSNTDDVHFEALRDQLPARLWEKRALSQEVRAQKPDARFFLTALARLGVEPERVFFLDDRAENVAAARALGIEAERVLGLAEATAALETRDILSPGAR